MKELEQNSWNEVDGSELKIPKGAILDVMRKDGHIIRKVTEDSVDWIEVDHSSDIVKWRFHKFREEIPSLFGKVFDKVDNMSEKLDKVKPEFHGDFSSMTEDQQDAVINPSHYKLIPSEAYEKFPDGLEYMNLMEYILSHHNGVEAHLLGQIFKYAVRLGKKDDDLQDAKKIQWYANYLVNVIKERNA